MAAYWLVKSEPHKYSFAQLKKDKTTVWDGVRNYEARNNLRAMKKGDLVLFYHSNEDKAVVGVAKVRREAYGDPSDESDTWSVVELAAVVAFKVPVALDTIRETPSLSEILMLKRNRISVTPVRPQELTTILGLGKTKLPAAKPSRSRTRVAAEAPTVRAPPAPGKGRETGASTKRPKPAAAVKKRKARPAPR